MHPVTNSQAANSDHEVARYDMMSRSQDFFPEVWYCGIGKDATICKEQGPLGKSPSHALRAAEKLTRL